MNKIMLCIFLIAATALFTDCYRGQPSKKPPIHLIPDMDSQPKYDAQEQSSYFWDGSTMRLPVEGTVAIGHLNDNVAYYKGKNNNGSFVKANPVEVTLPMLKRGQQRYNIYCAPCHGQVGDGNGIIVKKGYLPPPSFHSERIRALGDGAVCDIISNGIRNMPSYAHQIPVQDRWAIVAYVQALQKSQNATINDVPEELREKITKK
jgi:mono/diheme cytochrome c family protein